MVRALLRVRVEAFAIVAADAFSHDDLRSANGAPLTRLLADAARAALRPALDAEHRQVGHDAEKCAKRTEKPTIGVAHEHSRHEESTQPCQEHGGTAMKPEHPEGLDVRIDQRVAGDQEVADDTDQDAVLDP